MTVIRVIFDDRGRNASVHGLPEGEEPLQALAEVAAIVTKLARDFDSDALLAVPDRGPTANGSCQVSVQHGREFTADDDTGDTAPAGLEAGEAPWLDWSSIEFRSTANIGRHTAAVRDVLRSLLMAALQSAGVSFNEVAIENAPQAATG